jgi:outer membrane lipoprotein SlyB
MNTIIRQCKFVAVLFVAAMCSACGTMNAQAQMPLPLSGAVIGSVGQVEYGVVQAVRTVQIQQPNESRNYAGTTVGALIGTAIGSKIGKGNGRVLAMTLGGLAGASAGNRIGQQAQYSTALEIEVHLDNGKTMVITQANGGQFFSGQRVRVINNAGRYSVAA